MKHRCKFMGLMLLAFTATCLAGTPKWKSLSYMDDTPFNGPGARAEYDAGTLERHGALVIVWERFVYERPKTIEGMQVSAMMTRYYYDCAAETFYSGSIRAFDQNGNAVYSSDEVDSEVRPLLPGTTGHNKLKHYCR